MSIENVIESSSNSVKLFLTDPSPIPVDTERKLNVHKTFRRRPGRLLNVLCTFNLRPVSTGIVKNVTIDQRIEISQ